MAKDDPIAALETTIQRAACAISELLEARVPPAFTPPDHPALQDSDTKRDYYHDYLPGDRVIIRSGEGHPPSGYGHVISARHGCNDGCRLHCRLVTVNIEGGIRLPSGNTVLVVGEGRYRLDQVDHAD